MLLLLGLATTSAASPALTERVALNFSVAARASHQTRTFAQNLATAKLSTTAGTVDDDDTIPEGCYDFPESFFDTGACSDGSLVDCSSSLSFSDGGYTLTNVQTASSCYGCGSCTGTTIQSLSYGYGTVDISGTDVSYDGDDCSDIEFTPAHGTFDWNMDGSDLSLGGTTLTRNYFGGLSCIVFLGINLGTMIGISGGLVVLVGLVCCCICSQDKSQPPRRATVAAPQRGHRAQPLLASHAVQQRTPQYNPVPVPSQYSSVQYGNATTVGQLSPAITSAVPTMSAVAAPAPVAPTDPVKSLIVQLRAKETHAVQARDYIRAGEIKTSIDEIEAVIQQQEAAVAQRRYAEASQLEETLHAAMERARVHLAATGVPVACPSSVYPLP